MKTLFKFSVIALSVFAAASCSKLKNNTTADPNAKQHNEDVENIKSESDNVNTDVNTALSGISGFSKNFDAQASISICGAAIDSSHQHDAIPYIIITFDGITHCPNPERVRSGTIKVELINGSRWADIGAQLRLTYTDYKVTFTSLNNHYLTFNGTKYLTDVSGINWLSVYLGTSTITLRERSYDMIVTFENGNQSHWNSARVSTWGISGGITNPQIYAIVNGDTIINGKTIDSWGTTRFNTNFTTQMLTPWKSGTSCGWWRPTQGKYTSVTDNFSVTATFGVDGSGNPVSSGCPGYFKLEWTITSSGDGGNVVLGYW